MLYSILELGLQEGHVGMQTQARHQHRVRQAHGSPLGGLGEYGAWALLIQHCFEGAQLCIYLV